MILEKPICRLAGLFGIENNTSVENKVFLLQAMGVLPRDFSLSDDQNTVLNNSKLLQNIIKEQIDAEYTNVVHQVSVLRQNRVNELIIALPEGTDKIRWELQEEENDPEQLSENNYSGAKNVMELTPLKDNRGEDCARVIDGITYRKYKFSFPFNLDLGYFDLKFSFRHPQSGQEISHTSRLISAPEKCYDNLGIKEGKKTWGIPVQLYEQVSENNLGIGNYSDLAQIANTLGKNGAGIIGVNPLHAMRDDQPENASPYEPDSRMFYNYLYLDVTAIKEFKEDPEIRAYYHSPAFQERVRRNRRKEYVDYAETQELADDIIWRCFKKFSSNKNSEEYKRWRVYCDVQGETLEKYATFRALCRAMAQQKPAPITWQQWRRDFRNPNSESVKQFQRENRDEINFYKYSQWQCNHQLENVQKTCLNSGMKIGLYTDNSVGSSCRGFEAWAYSDLFLKAAAGAPPDVLSQSGQNWGVQGYNPIKLREYGYEPYCKTIRNNMKYAGCTRIDHVLQLQRLYMIPEGKKATEGAFIYYNTDELMAIVALESHLNKCMVIGEDLGMIPDGFRPKLEDFGILSYRVMPFEREWGFKTGYGTNAMKHPNEYPVASVCSSSTHDTPSLFAQWNVQDIYQKHKLGLISESQANDKFEQYATQREALNYALSEKGCWERVGGKPCTSPRQDAARVPEKYIQAVMDYLGQSNSAIMLIPFSDIFGTKEMGNIPGTKELPVSKKSAVLEIPSDVKVAYPNWRKKMYVPVEHIDQVPIFKEVADIVNRYRPDGNDGKGKYYQFVRMGEHNEPVVDFERYLHLYERLRKKEMYKQENIIEHRYSPKRCEYWHRLTNQTKQHYNTQKEQFAAFKKAILLQKAAVNN